MKNVSNEMKVCNEEDALTPFDQHLQEEEEDEGENEEEEDGDDDDDDENDKEELGTAALLGPEIRDDADAAAGTYKKGNNRLSPGSRSLRFSLPLFLCSRLRTRGR